MRRRTDEYSYKLVFLKYKWSAYLSRYFHSPTLFSLVYGEDVNINHWARVVRGQAQCSRLRALRLRMPPICTFLAYLHLSTHAHHCLPDMGKNRNMKRRHYVSALPTHIFWDFFMLREKETVESTWAAYWIVLVVKLPTQWIVLNKYNIALLF